jgi:hypothetical protein
MARALLCKSQSLVLVVLLLDVEIIHEVIMHTQEEHMYPSWSQLLPLISHGDNACEFLHYPSDFHHLKALDVWGTHLLSWIMMS